MRLSLQDLIKHPVKTINSQRGLRYLAAGSASEAIEYVGFLLLIWAFPNSLYVSNSISFILGVISGFVFHKIYTFRGEHQFKTHQQFIGYVSLAGINFIAINIFIGVYVDGLGLAPAIGKLLAIATTLIWTYTISTFVIFRHKKAA